MKVSPINAYKSTYIQGTNYLENINSNISLEKISSENDKKDSLTISNNDVLTKKERQFFIKMFPESSEQIENHILFNRNGKTQNYNLTKGSLLDSRV